jgi:hypothetical protein
MNASDQIVTLTGDVAVMHVANAITQPGNR